jgi:hypothetical protein
MTATQSRQTITKAKKTNQKQGQKNNDEQNTRQETKDCATGSSLISRDELIKYRCDAIRKTI